jgi:hypothetical protein
MSFYFVRNLTDKNLSTCEPWVFPGEKPSEKVCKSKEDRQFWYRSKSTDWQFYTSVEPILNTQRVSKDNVPYRLHGFCADFDLPLTDARIDEVVGTMKMKPQWIERSLGGNCRLVFVLDRPILLDSYAHSVFVIQQASSWLNLGLLPGLDEGAFTDPTRLLCNGGAGAWRATGHPPVGDPDLQAFIVKTGLAFRFSPVTKNNDIPLDVIEKAIRERFPGFSWPSDFVVGSAGPSFWITDSVSPMSARIKPDGIFTFSAHAVKPFYSWADILGPEFTRGYADGAMAAATKDIFWDGKNFWRKVKGVYKACAEKEMDIHFRVDCGMSNKKDKSGTSPIDKALSHLHNECRVDGAAPFLFRPQGRIEYMGQPVLNITSTRIMLPAPEPGPYPFMEEFMPRFFVTQEQYDRWRAWFRYFYISGLEGKPRPGQAIFIVGKPGHGKGFISHEVVGKAMGGFTDASAFLVRGDTFGSENFHKAVLCIDDESAGGNNYSHDRFGSMLKKTVANQEFRYHAKFKEPCMVEWNGRVIVTLNLDYTSTRIMVSMDNSNLDKICIFKCTSDENIKSCFPERYALQAQMQTELPNYLHDLVKWEPPGGIPRDGRFGFASYHDAEILDQSHQTSKSAPFKEILLEELASFFELNKDATEWRGTVTQLFRLISSNVYNDGMIRRMNIEHIHRYIEAIAKEGIIKCSAETGEAKTRVWTFQRPEISKPLPIFSK